jgi:hypothetical protein
MSRKLSLVFSIAMLMAFAMPVAAAPSAGGAAAGTVRASHVANCDDIVIAANGTILVNGIALTAAQLALLSADARAALQLAANADANANADVCVDVAASLAPLSVAVNADIVVCGTAVVTASNATVGGAAIPAALLSAGLREALAIAAAANVNTCLTTTITNGNVVANVSLDACVRARLNSAGQIVVTAGGTDFVLDGFSIVGTTGALNTSAAVTIGLRLGAGLNVATDAQTLTVQVTTITGCAATLTGEGVSPEGASIPGGASFPFGAQPFTVGSAPGAGQLPDTAMQAGTDSTAIPALALIALLMSGLSALRTREARI